VLTTNLPVLYFWSGANIVREHIFFIVDRSRTDDCQRNSCHNKLLHYRVHYLWFFVRKSQRMVVNQPSGRLCFSIRLDNIVCCPPFIEFQKRKCNLFKGKIPKSSLTPSRGIIFLFITDLQCWEMMTDFFSRKPPCFSFRKPRAMCVDARPSSFFGVRQMTYSFVAERSRRSVAASGLRQRPTDRFTAWRAQHVCSTRHEVQTQHVHYNLKYRSIPVC